MTDEERAELLAARAALKKAMRSGALSVAHGDKRVQYRPIAEMQSALDDLNEELSATPRRKVWYVTNYRGF
ncbi:phage head-tail joining protein [Breoghania sp.]|uniref:phage head-tail joining protein n=1 Tax=Breoghania sp. TaxID=2065378 RepID=UPI002AA8CF12|nr:hypothetical protein [Breoghania sp.]